MVAQRDVKSVWILADLMVVKRADLKDSLKAGMMEIEMADV